ncbi:MAG: copper homeostasis protein CutC [Acidobacteriota bacterium]
MKNKILVEVCVDSVESALAAELGGADRVELCDNLMEGGTTPSFASIEIARQRLKIGLHVIIRPRGGDFLYSDLEFEIMKRDIEIAKQIGVDGVVIGILDEYGSIDIARNRELIQLAKPLSVTFHRAFDVTANAQKSLNSLIDLGFERVLTSGQEATAFEGLETIAELVKTADEKIIVMACGSLNERNVRKFVEKTNVKEVHLTGFTKVQSQMKFRNERVFMGGTLRPPEFDRNITSSQILESICNRLQ